jgi:hypothetical protein
MTMDDGAETIVHRPSSIVIHHNVIARVDFCDCAGRRYTAWVYVTTNDNKRYL